MGLVASKIEAAGISTVCLSNIPDLTASTPAPRLVGIEYPSARTLGKPGDAAGQMAVLRGTLEAAEGMKEPGTRIDLPFKWPESPAEARSHPAEPPPIATHIKRKPWLLLKLMAREIPR